MDSKVDQDTGEIFDENRFLLRYYNVFNSQQCTFDEIGEQKIQQLSGASRSRFNERYFPGEDIVERMPNRPTISPGLHETPCYIPSIDEVQLPEIKYFVSSDAYYAALFHELVHSTGHSSRLNRFESDHHSNEVKYSREELVAELGSSYLCAIAGIEPDVENAAAYVKSWLKVLKNNPTWIVWAASRAQKACEYIVPTEVSEEAPF